MQLTYRYTQHSSTPTHNSEQARSETKRMRQHKSKRKTNVDPALTHNTSHDRDTVVAEVMDG